MNDTAVNTLLSNNNKKWPPPTTRNNAAVLRMVVVRRVPRSRTTPTKRWCCCWSFNNSSTGYNTFQCLWPNRKNARRWRQSHKKITVNHTSVRSQITLPPCLTMILGVAWTSFHNCLLQMWSTEGVPAEHKSIGYISGVYAMWSW